LVPPGKVLFRKNRARHIEKGLQRKPKYCLSKSKRHTPKKAQKTLVLKKTNRQPPKAIGLKTPRVILVNRLKAEGVSQEYPKTPKFTNTGTPRRQENQGADNIGPRPQSTTSSKENKRQPSFE
jgi:hypothetical protein